MGHRDFRAMLMCPVGKMSYDGVWEPMISSVESSDEASPEPRRYDDVRMNSVCNLFAISFFLRWKFPIASDTTPTSFGLQRQSEVIQNCY